MNLDGMVLALVIRPSNHQNHDRNWYTSPRDAVLRSSWLVHIQSQTIGGTVHVFIPEKVSAISTKCKVLENEIFARHFAIKNVKRMSHKVENHLSF